MGEVISAADANAWSISRISEAFGMARETVAKKLREAGVAPAAKRSGYPVYAIRDVAPVLFSEPAFDPDDEGQKDPKKLPPKDRKDWYSSEKERLAVERELAQLIPADEVAAGIAETFKKVALALDTMVDVIERDAGLDGKQLEIMQRIIDSARAQLADGLAGGD